MFQNEEITNSKRFILKKDSKKSLKLEKEYGKMLKEDEEDFLKRRRDAWRIKEDDLRARVLWEESLGDEEREGSRGTAGRSEGPRETSVAAATADFGEEGVGPDFTKESFETLFRTSLNLAPSDDYDRFLASFDSLESDLLIDVDKERQKLKRNTKNGNKKYKSIKKTYKKNCGDSLTNFDDLEISLSVENYREKVLEDLENVGAYSVERGDKIAQKTEKINFQNDGEMSLASLNFFERFSLSDNYHHRNILRDSEKDNERHVEEICEEIQKNSSEIDFKSNFSSFKGIEKSCSFENAPQQNVGKERMNENESMSDKTEKIDRNKDLRCDESLKSGLYVDYNRESNLFDEDYNLEMTSQISCEDLILSSENVTKKISQKNVGKDYDDLLASMTCPLESVILAKTLEEKKLSYNFPSIDNKYSKERLENFTPFKTVDERNSILSDCSARISTVVDENKDHILEHFIRTNKTDSRLSKEHIKRFTVGSSRETYLFNPLRSINCSIPISLLEENERKYDFGDFESIGDRDVKDIMKLFERFSKRLSKISIKFEVRIAIKHITKRIIREIANNEKRKRNKSITLEQIQTSNTMSIHEDESFHSKEKKEEILTDNVLVVESTFYENINTDDSTDPELKHLCQNCKGTLFNMNSASTEYIKPFSLVQPLEENIINRKPLMKHCATTTSPVPISEKEEDITKKFSGFLNCMSGQDQDFNYKIKNLNVKRKVKSTSQSIFQRLFSRSKTRGKNIGNEHISLYCSATSSKLEKSISSDDEIRNNLNYSNKSSPECFIQNEKKLAKNEWLEFEHQNRSDNYNIPTDLVRRVSSIKRFKKSYFPKLTSKIDQNMKVLTLINGPCAEMTRNSGAVFIID